MNPQLLELALKKQRLQLQCAAQREALAVAGVALAPVFALADGVRAGARWVARHPEWLAGIVVALLVIRPRAVFRWARRGFFGWQLWRRVRAWRPAATFGR